MRLFPWIGTALLILTIFVPLSVSATPFDGMKSSQTDVQFLAPNSDQTSISMNLMEDDSIELEKDVILGELPGVEGRYYGAYVKSSLFEFGHEAGFIEFATNYTISSSYIMNGASRFWVRVPVIPSQYTWWHVFCDWGYSNTVEGARISATDFWYSLMPWTDPAWDWEYFSSYYYDSGNVWSTYERDNYQLRQTDTGIYIQLDGIFRSNENFTVIFQGALNPGEKAQVFLTSEKQTVNQTQAFRFYDTYQIYDSVHSINEYGFTYDYNETLEVVPSWAFVFINGIGKEGMLSYEFLFDNNLTREDDYITWGIPYDMDTGYINSYETNIIHTWNQDHFLSFYMPFTASVIGTNPGIRASQIDWHIYMEMVAGGYFSLNSSPGIAPGIFDTQQIDFWMYDTENFLLFSSPYFVHDFSGILPDHQDVRIKLVPLPQCSIIFLASNIDVQRNQTAPYAQDTYWGRYFHEEENASWNQSLPVNAHVYPMYNWFSWTQGRYAQLNETKDYTIYDFGWGLGYYYPGLTHIYMFMDNGGSLFFNTTYLDFLDTLKDESFWGEVIDTLAEAVAAIVGFIWDGIQWVWNTLVSIGTWIYNTVSNIIGWIISVVTDIAGKVSAIVQEILYGMPIIILIFVVNYAGTALYSGHLPKLGKERRLLKRMRPKSIMKRRAKYQRKLKYPVVETRRRIEKASDWYEKRRSPKARSEAVNKDRRRRYG